MLLIVSALACEARPLISHFKLSLVQSSPFPLYQKDDAALVISGVGKIHAAAATAYLYSFLHHPLHSSWLNIGIAGHATLEIGTGVMAHQVMDQSSKRVYYPVFIKEFPCATHSFLTVEHPAYENASVCEMEASGFYATATRFSTLELIHSYKIISDNQTTPFHLLNQKQVEELMTARINQIEQIAIELQALSQQFQAMYNLNIDKAPFVNHWHFTSSQLHQLERLLQRWEACQTTHPIWDDKIASLKRTSDVLKYIENKINALPLHF
jgi:adenosylhomocysteine nucleosidase